jgi:hypothetical protein
VGWECRGGAWWVEVVFIRADVVMDVAIAQFCKFSIQIKVSLQFDYVFDPSEVNSDKQPVPYAMEEYGFSSVHPRLSSTG